MGFVSSTVHSQDFTPSKPLLPFVKGYKIITCDNERVNRIVPGTSLALAFRLKGQTSYLFGEHKQLLPSATLSGLRKSVRLISYQADSSTLLVMFKEAGASAFFRAPMNELFEESLPLEWMTPRSEVAQLEEQLAEAESDRERIDLIETFLLQRLAPANDLAVLAAVQKIRDHRGNIRIHELADSLCISRDAFEKRFRKVIGATPKQFASIVRMGSLVHLAPSHQPFVHHALEAGFFDQAHFNKDFKLFTGLTPTDFFMAPVFW